MAAKKKAVRKTRSKKRAPAPPSAPTPASTHDHVTTTQDSDRIAALRYFQRMHEAPEQEREYAMRVLKKYQQEILSKHGVLSIDAGIKYCCGQFTGVFSIRVYVEKKWPIHTKGLRIPKGHKVLSGFVVPAKMTKSDLIPSSYDGIPTDIIESGGFHLAALPRPQGGDAIWAEGPDPDAGNAVAKSGEGTMALGVIDEKGREFFLTCMHCFSFKDHSVSAPVVNSVRQVLAAEQISGNLMNARTVGQVRPETCRIDGVVDCALVTPDPKRKFFRVPVRGATESQPVSIRLPREGDEVWTRGRNPEERRFGKVASVTGSFPLPGGAASKQIMIHSSDTSKPFATEGDSGAVICVGDSAIGIVRAVSSTNGIVAACPLMTTEGTGVAEVLGFTLQVPVKP